MSRLLTEEEKAELRLELAAMRALVPPYDPTPQEALDELIMGTTCRCDRAWTDRGRHANDCFSEYRAEVVTLGRAARLKVPA